MTLKWKETDTGDHALYAGEIKVGGVLQRVTMDCWGGFTSLPSTVSGMGYYETPHDAQQAVESAVKAWFEATEKEVTE